MQHEAPGLQRAPEVAFQAQAVHRPRIHLGPVEARVIAAGFLGPVHRDVGALDQQFGGAGVARIHRDAGAAADRDHIAAGVERRPHRLQHLLHQAQRQAARRPVRQHQQELVAAQAGNRVRLPQMAFHALRHPLQQQVARLVAQAVVDALESVEIDKHHP
jgi:hypothetical protein